MTDGYPDPLAGDKSVAELTKLIHETMPDDEDEKCSADDSAKVAAYIFDAFYSADAGGTGRFCEALELRVVVLPAHVHDAGDSRNSSRGF